jgi:hypothetical protein
MRHSLLTEWLAFRLLAGLTSSVNLSEPGWAEICGLLRDTGIAAEAGIWSKADARELGSLEVQEWLRILVEVIDVPTPTR